jgi:hypothetical protein
LAVFPINTSEILVLVTTFSSKNRRHHLLLLLRVIGWFLRVVGVVGILGVPSRLESIDKTVEVIIIIACCRLVPKRECRSHRLVSRHDNMVNLAEERERSDDDNARKDRTTNQIPATTRRMLDD